jgi:hypothetical protein
MIPDEEFKNKLSDAQAKFNVDRSDALNVSAYEAMSRGTSVRYPKPQPWTYKAYEFKLGWGIIREGHPRGSEYLTSNGAWHDEESNMAPYIYKSKAEAEFVARGFMS